MKKIFLIIITSAIVINAQDNERGKLDSLFNQYIKIKSIPSGDSPVALEPQEKCGFGLVNQIHSNADKLTLEQKNILKELMSPPVLQKSVLTPSGLFRVHYDSTGTNSIKYNLQLLLQAVDSSYNYEVNYLGYPPPPTDENEIYHIYVQNTGSLYGYTETEGLVNGQITSFIVIDNDFSTTATKGINAACVTVAHELHHAIQIGNYKFAEEDIYFHELSSTAMEEFVYDSINDYYYYMDDYFNRTYESFPSHQGYDIAIWNLFMVSEFGFDILERQWELLRQNRALDAIALSINAEGANFQEVFNRFGIWIFFTNYRSITGKYFEEAVNYPPAKKIMNRLFTPPSDSLNINAEPLTHNFFTEYNTSGDSLTILISNSDYKNALINYTVTQPALYELSTDSSEGMEYLAEGFYSNLTTGTSRVFWASSEFLNNQLIKEGYISVESQTPFPSPFRYSKHNIVYFPVKKNPENEIELNIYSTSMDLIYSSRIPISLIFGKDMVTWNGRSSASQKLGSGIYFYVIKSGDDISKGKLVVFND